MPVGILLNEAGHNAGQENASDAKGKEADILRSPGEAGPPLSPLSSKSSLVKNTTVST